MPLARDAIRRILFLSLMALLAQPTGASAGRLASGCERSEIVHGNRQERTLAVDGVERTFILDVPDTVQPRRAVPLLLDFHGFGHSAAGVWRVSGFRELGVRERFITVYPQGLDVELLGRRGPGWEIASVDGNREVAFVLRLLETLEHEYCIDRSRIYATGFSNGAFLSHLLGCALSDRIAAIAPVSGGTANVACRPARAVSVMVHHGRNDSVVPVERGRQLFQDWKKLDGCPGTRPMAAGEACERAVDCSDGASVVYCEFDGEHRWPPEATGRIWEFLATHPLRP